MPDQRILFILFSYLLGSVPFGYIIYYMVEKKDIRSVGSGNIGATNVLRSKGIGAGLITLLMDTLKGIIPVLYGLSHFDSPALVIGGGAAAVLGHQFPVFLKFRGGKGVATFLGAVTAFQFPLLIVFGLIFLFATAVTKYVSAGSILGALSVFFYSLFLNVERITIIILVVTILVVIKHHGNIKRIIEGKENRLRLRK